jgi:hypothetical protein
MGQSGARQRHQSRLISSRRIWRRRIHHQIGVEGAHPVVDVIAAKLCVPEQNTVALTARKNIAPVTREKPGRKWRHGTVVSGARRVEFFKSGFAA